MAFMDFVDAAPGGLPIAHSALFAVKQAARPEQRADHASVTEADESLSTLERRIVELARGDGLQSLRPPRKRSWLGRMILGPAAPSPVLANERLEALRRLAVQAWHHGYTLPASALIDACKAGYDEVRIGAVLDLVARAQPPVRRLAA